MEKRIQTIECYQLTKRMAMLCFIALLFSFKGLAQTDTEFWFAAPEVDSTHADSSIMRFASINAVDVTLSIPKNPSFTPITFHLAPNSDTLIDWNRIGAGKINFKNAIENTALDVPANKGIHIVATDKIEAYYEVKTLPNSEVFALKGANGLGRTFFVNMQNYWYNKPPLLSNGDDTLQFGTFTTNPIGRDSLPLPFAVNDYQDIVAENSWSSFDIVATEDGTTIEITPTNPIISSTNTLDQYGFITSGAYHPTGVTYTITLDAGQTYSGRQAYKNPTRSLGGTKIQVTNSTGHKIALTCKEDGLMAWNHDNAGIYLNPTDNSTTNLYDWSNYAMDLIGDQMIPVDLIGNEYVVMRGGLYPDVDQNPNTPPKTWDFDGERVFMTIPTIGTTITVQSFSNTGALLNTTTLGPSTKIGQVFSYTFKYNSTKANIEQFLRITSNGNNFYTYHVSGQLSELGSGIIPTITGCTGSTQLAFTRSYNGLFQVNLMVKQGAEGSFKVYDSKGNDVSTTFNIQASNFIAIPGSGWSVYIQPNNDWTKKALIDQTYTIKNTLNVFHLGILNISSFKGIDTNRVPQYIGWYQNPKNLKTFRGYPFGKTVPSSIISKVWKNPNWSIKKVDTNPTDHIYYSLTNLAGDTVIYVAHWYSDSRGAFYGYFSDFNKFTPFAAVPDANHPKCLGDTIKLIASGGVTYKWTPVSNLKFLDPDNTQNPRVIPMTSGTYNLQVYIQGFCSKDTTYKFSFNVVAPPVPTITGPSNVCIGSVNQTYVVSTADTNGFGTSIKTWSVVGGTIISGQATPTVVVNWPSSGNQSISVSLNNKSCKVGSTTLPVTITSLPTVSVPSDIIACNGDNITVPAFSSNVSSANYSWTNDNPSINVAASGSGQIGTFISKNSTTTPIIATISVTPTLGCIGTPNSFKITVNPTPSVTQVADTAICNGVLYPGKTFTSIPAGSTYSWSNSNLAIGLQTTGNGKIPTFTATNSGTTSITGTIAVTPHLNGCDGIALSNVITVNPSPSITVQANATVCNGVQIAGSTFSGTPTGVVFEWSNDNVGINLASSGTGQIPSFTASNSNTNPIIANISVVPTANGCTGIAKKYTITVNPTPTVSVPVNSTVCSGKTISATNFASSTTGATFAWSNDQSSIGIGSSGNGQIPLFTATNTSGSLIKVYITVTASANSCSGTPKTYSISVNPLDNASFTYSPNTFCQTGSNPIPTISGVTGGTFSSNPTGLKFVSTSTGEINLLGSTLKGYDVTYTTNGTCPNSSMVHVQITTAPSATFAFAGPYCQDASNPSPNFIAGASGGVFSADKPGLVINSSTGQVDLKASSPGDYTVTNFIAAASGCAAATASAPISIKPIPTVSVPSNTIVCNNGSVLATTFTSNVAGTITWTNSNSAINLALSGNGQIVGFNATNTINSQIIATITVTPPSNGCTVKTNSYTIAVNPSPVVYNQTVKVCQLSSKNITIHSTGGTAPMGSGSWVISGGGSSVTYFGAVDSVLSVTANNTTGITKFSYTLSDNLGCSGTGSITIQNIALPSVTIASVGVCQNLPLTLTPVISGVNNPKPLWSSVPSSPALIPSNQTSASSVNAITATEGTYNVSVLVTDSIGCSATSTTAITVYPKVTAGVSPIFGSHICQNSELVLTGNQDPNGKTYFWTGSDVASTISPNDRVTTFKSSVLKNHDYIFHVVSNNGCRDSIPYTVNVDENPTIDLGANVETCSGFVKVISANPTGGSGPYSYSWADEFKALTYTGNSPSFLSSITGQHKMYVTVTDASTCIGMDSITVTVNANPTVSPIAASVCLNESVVLNGNPSGGTPVYTNEWSGADVANIIANLNTDYPTFSSAKSGSNSIHYKVIDSKGCIGEKDATVFVNSLPQPLISNNKSLEVCAKADLALNVTGVTGATAYTWSGTGVSYLKPDTKSQNPMFNSAVAGSYTLSVAVTDGNSCIGYDAITILVDTLPKPIVSNDSLCSGATILLKGDKRFSKVQWTGDVSAIPSNELTSNTPTFTSTFVKTYNLKYTVTDSKNCTDSVAVSVKVNALPGANAGSDRSFSYGDTLHLVGSPIGSQFTYLWTPKDSLIDNTVSNPISLPLHKTFSLGFTVQNKVTLCKDSSRVTVRDTTGVLRITITPRPAVICVGDTAYLELAVAGGKPTYKYSWTPSFDNLYVNGSIRVKPTVTTTYSLTVTDANGTKEIASTVVTVNQIPTITLKDLSICKNDTDKIIPDIKYQAGASAKTIQWSGGTATGGLHGVTNQANVDYFYTQANGASNLTLTVIDNNNCKSSSIMSVTVHDLPIVSIKSSLNAICPGSSADLSVVKTNGTAPFIYKWSDLPSTHLLKITDSTYTYSSTVTGISKVTLSVTDTYGCKDTNVYYIKVNENPISLANDTAVCLNNSLVLRGRPKNGATPYTHSWIMGNININPGNADSAIFYTQNATPGVNTNVIYQVKDNNGCISSKPINVKVNLLPSATYGPQPLAVCQGNTINVAATPNQLGLTGKWINPGNSSQVGNSYPFMLDSVGNKKIYYELIDGNKCKLRDSIFVTLKPKPVVTIDTITPQCAGSLGVSVIAYPSIISVSNPNFTYSWIGTKTTTDVSPILDISIPGRKTIKLVVTETTVGCSSAIVSKQVYVKQNPSVTVATDKIPACEGQVLPLNVNPTNLLSRSFEWIAGSGLAFLTPASPTKISNPSFNTTVVGSYDLIYKITDSSCITLDTLHINVKPTPDKVTIYQQYCQNSSVQIDVRGMKATTYQWLGTSNDLSLLSPSSPSIGNPTISTTKVGKFTYKVKGTIGTCYDTSIVSISVSPNPTVTGIPVQDSAYYKQPYQFNAKVTPSLNYTYAWSPTTDFKNASILNAQTKPVIADMNNISLTVTETSSGQNCKTTINTKLYVRKRMDTNFNPDPTCKGDKVKLNGTVSGGDPNKTYTWSTTDGIIHTGTSFDYISNETNTVSLTVTDSYDTVSVSHQNISYPLPPVIHDSTKTCAGDIINLTVPGVITDQTVWSGVGSQKLTLKNTQSTQFVTSKNESSQKYELYAQTTNKYGCSATDTINITVNENPKILVQDTVHVITGQSTTLTIGTSSQYLYEWTPPTLFVDATKGTVTTKTLTRDTIIKVVVIDKISGCKHDTTIIIKVDSAISVKINPIKVCQGTSVTINAETKHAKGTSTYIWSDGNGTILQNGTNSSLTFLPSQSTSINVSVTDGFSSANDVENITVNPTPSVAIKPDLHTYIIGQAHTFYSISSSGTKPYVYNWSANGNATLVPEHADTTQFNTNSVENYRITLILNDANNCSDTANVNPESILEPDWTDKMCSNQWYDFKTDSRYDLKWKLNGVKDSTFIGKSTKLIFSNGGNGVITLYDLNDSINPIYTFEYTVNQKPLVNFIYTPDTGISIGEKVSFVNNSIRDVNNQILPNHMSFFWDFVGDQVYTSELIDPTYSYDDIGVFNVSLIGMDTITHCRDTVVKKLEVKPNSICGLKFPNAFTPEAVKDNHFLPGYIVGIKDSGYNLQIFNRWGQLLFETSTKTGKWDGFYKGETCKQDVYVYHCKAVCENGKDIYINGDVTLIK